jgi:prolipoprotein diacylglyceryltransferase
MEINSQTSSEYFKSLRIIHLAMIAGQILFASIAIFVTQKGITSPDSQELKFILTIIVPIFIIGGFVGSIIIYNKKIKAISQKNNLKEILTDYKAALVSRYAMLEGPSFFAIIAYTLTHNILFMGLAAMVILSFTMISPSKEKTIEELKLDSNNQKLLSDPNTQVI